MRADARGRGSSMKPGAKRPRPENNQPVDAMNAGGFRNWGGEGGDPKSKVRRTFVPDGTSEAETVSHAIERGAMFRSSRLRPAL